VGGELLRDTGRRLPWLVSLLFLGLAVSGISGYFEGVVDELPMLVAFQPLVLGMAGNAGTQSLAVTVRRMAEKGVGSRRYRGMIVSETRVALLSGLIVGAASFFIVCGYLYAFGRYPLGFCAAAAGSVGGAMTLSMLVSGITGAAIPLALRRLGADPAVASGPLITTVSDLCAIISYYSLAWVMLVG